MTQQKTNLTLPEDIRARFDKLRAAENTDDRNALVKALREANWTLQSIADASRLTRERVRQVSLMEFPDALPEVPVPPQKATKPEPTYIEPEPEALARLIELQPLAVKVRAKSSNYRAEAEEYSRIVADQHLKKGVTLYRLSLRLTEAGYPMSNTALRARLVRYDHMTPPQGGKSRVYKKVDKANRAL